LASTEDRSYTDRLRRKEGAWWKRALDVQRPYRWNLRRLGLGFTLDLGCGLGRNLQHLEGTTPGLAAVGVDHNPTSVAECRARGLTAFTPEEFLASEFARPATFDSLLAAHLVEHLTPDDAAALLETYLPFVRDGGRVVLITPQTRGYASDPTHVTYVDDDGAKALLTRIGVTPDRSFSFPFPAAAVGKVFTYNEFVTLGWRGTPPPR
jgi:SAM-dependent methyltransferase